MQNSIPAEEQRAVTLSLPAVLHERIRAYRAERHLDSDQKALRDLIERGLEAYAAEPGTVKVDLGVREDREELSLPRPAGARCGAAATTEAARPRSAARTGAAAEAARPAAPAGLVDLALRHRQEAFALSLLARRLARPPDRLGLLAGLALGGLLVGAALLHLPENALALHPLLEDAQGLVDVVVTNEHLQSRYPFESGVGPRRGRGR